MSTPVTPASTLAKQPIQLERLPQKPVLFVFVRIRHAKGDACLKLIMDPFGAAQAAVVRETQHPDGLQKIQHLEDSSHYQRSQMEEVSSRNKQNVSTKLDRNNFSQVSITQAPKFTQPLQGPTTMSENQSCHFETRLEPMGDADMKVEW